MHCIIAGSRTITNYLTVAQAIVDITNEFDFRITEVISGHAKGVDQCGEEWARINDIPCHVMPAEWNRYGRSAGIRRNGAMADYARERKAVTGQPAGLILVWDGKSKGSASMWATGLYKELICFQKIIPPLPSHQKELFP